MRLTSRAVRSLGMGSMILLVGSLLLGGCGGSAKNASGDNATETGAPSRELRFNPNVRIGDVIWTNEQGDFVVVQMDTRRDAFEPQFFLALDPAGGQVSAVLVGGGEVQGRSFGARVLEGVSPVGAEIRLPGAEWTQYLYNRYNQSERLPASPDGTF